ncbi:MAG: amidohydrolase family protein [Gemmatimonadota bacterium]
MRYAFAWVGGTLVRSVLPVMAVASFLMVPQADAQVPAAPQSRAVALTGGTVHPVSGPDISNGTVLFVDGVITAVGTNVSIPPDAERVDVTGRHVYPGLIDGFSQVGLYEIGSIDLTIDTNEFGAFNPNARVEVAVNPESRHIGTTRSNGVLVSITTPGGGLVSGLSAALALDGWSWEAMTMRSRLALNVNWPNPNDADAYAAQIRELRRLFQTAREYRDVRSGGGSLPLDLRWEAMLPALAGDVPVVVSASELRQIQDAITWAEEEGIRLVLRGGTDAPYVADHLVAKGIPVLLTSTMAAPGRAWEPYDHAYALAGRLADLGVRFAITGGPSAPYANRLPYEAGVAVAFGLPEEEAVRAVTLYPAQIFGIDDLVGSIEIGKDATLIVTTGHPLDTRSRVEDAYIRGGRIDLNDIHRQLYEKYSEKVRQSRLPETSGN